MVLFNSQGNYLIPPELGLETRKGSKIPNEQRTQRHPTSMQAALAISQTGRPSVQPRSLSSVYNCMGMVFASRRTCIETEHLPMILREDNYRQVLSERDLTRGDLVVYKDQNESVTHVGIVTEIRHNILNGSTTITVLSQWGAHGEYFHLADEVHPSLGKPAEYWTDRT